MSEYVERVCFQLRRCGMEGMSCRSVTSKLGMYLPSIFDYDFESQFTLLVKKADAYVAAHPGCEGKRPQTSERF